MGDILPNNPGQPAPGKPWYQLSGDEVMRTLGTQASGLLPDEAAARESRYGRNELREARRKSRLAILVSQFRDLMILILIGAAAISLFVGERTDAAVILAIIAWLAVPAIVAIWLGLRWHREGGPA